MINRSYRELRQLESFIERYNYLRIGGKIGVETFGASRGINQEFYQSKEWRSVRNEVILRDAGCDLAVQGYLLYDRACVHHINPVTVDDFLDERWDRILGLDNLVCVSYSTHNAIHFGDEALLPKVPVDRFPGDTCPWR